MKEEIETISGSICSTKEEIERMKREIDPMQEEDDQ
jgi:hypothetical protein